MLKFSVSKIANLTGHRGPVYSLIKSTDNTLLSCSEDGMIAEWNYETSTDGRLITSIGKPVYSICQHPNMPLLFCGTSSGNIHVFNTEQKVEIKNIKAHSSGIFSLDILNGNLLSAGGDGFIHLWDAETLSIIKSVAASSKSARCISINHHETEIAVGFSDFSVKIYSDTLSLKNELINHSNSVFTIAYTADGQFIYSAGRDAMLIKTDITTGVIQYRVPAHTLQIKSLHLNSQKNLLLSCSMDKTIKLWDADNLTLLKVIDKDRNESHSNCINRIIWLDQDTFASCSDDRSIMIWKIA
jgi:WD40 repeat protein